MATYQRILVSLIEAISKNPECNIDEILISKAKEYGLNEDDIKAITETNSLIDNFSRKNEEIKEVKKEGKSRTSFIYDEITRITKDLSDDEKAVVAKAMQIASEELENNEK